MITKLDNNNDWTFGRSKANFIRGEAEVLQNVSTRLKMFKYDWLYNLEDGIDWVFLLGSKNKKTEIENEIKRVVLETEGILNITALDIITDNNRNATILMEISTIYSENISQTVEL